MKNYLFILLQIGCSSLLLGQNSSDHFAYKNLAKLNPIDLAQSKFQLHYERYLGEERKSSFLLIPAVYLREDSRESESGWELMAQYRFYLTHVRKDEGRTFLGFHNYGFYAGIYGLAMELNTDYVRETYDNFGNYTVGDYRSEIAAQEGGVLLGMQIDITKRIVLDFFVGGGVRNTKASDTYETETGYPYYDGNSVFEPAFKGVKPKVGLSVGMAF